MRMNVVREARFACPPEAAWAYFTDPARMPEFTGYGPIPGIDHAVILPEGPPSGVGLQREVHNRDGSTHREAIEVFAPPTHLRDRIWGLGAPMRWLARNVHDDFRFEALREGGTRLLRTFEVELSSPLWWPLALVARGFLGKAMDRHHVAAAKSLGL